MYRVLLVDDEFLVCNFLRGLIHWENYEYVICGEAHNGREALEMIPLLHPDIALVDVSMPGMDGIELMRILQQSCNHVQIIILSSYSDYDYVRETMKLGAVDYLLKHRLIPQELTRVLEVAKSRLIGCESPTAIELSQNEPHSSHTMAAGNISIRKFLEGRESEPPSAVLRLANTILTAAQVNIPVGSLLSSSTSEKSMEKFMESLLRICHQILLDVTGAKTVYMGSDRLAFLFPALPGESESGQDQRVGRCMGIIRDAAFKYHNAYLVWRTSRRCGTPWDLPTGYYEAVERLGDFAAEPKNGSMIYDSDIPSALTLDQERSLLSCVYRGDQAMLHTVLQDIFSPFGRDGLHKTALQLITSDILTLAAKLYRQRQLSMRPMQEPFTRQTAAAGFIDSKQLCSWLENLFVQFMKSQNTGKKWSETVRKAVAYLENNYMQEVGLARTAHHCSVNPAYLSHLFKKEVGMGLTQCLNRIRISHSMQLMLLDDVPASIVFLQVGFNNYNHFFNVFKSILGVSPAVFKREKKNMERMVSFDPIQLPDL